MGVGRALLYGSTFAAGATSARANAPCVGRGEPWHGAENLGWGTGALSTPAAMVTGWMESPGHRANLLDGRWRQVGVGVVPGTPRRTRIEGATYTLLLGSVERGPSRARAATRVMVGRKVRGGS